MYAQYFGLNEKPFSIAPDPRYLYQSERHAEALAHLLYGVNEAGGFIQLTGEVGTGKTTLIRALLNQMPESVEVAMILNPTLSISEFLHAICKDLGIPGISPTASNRALIDLLNGYLLQTHSKGGRVILIIDEAQCMEAELLEQLRLLTNLETSERKLLQIILIGQPELRATLARNDLRQLAQRITARYHLAPLTRDETASYVKHRLQIAGASRKIFTDGAVREIHRLSDGVPRLINVICDRALLGAYAGEKLMVDTALARKAAGEVQGRDIPVPARRWIGVAATIAALALLGFALFQFWPRGLLDGAARANNPTASTAVQEPVAGGPDLDAPSLAQTEAPEEQLKWETGQQGEGGIESASTGSLAASADAFDLAELLTTSRELTDNNTAFFELFRLWDKAYIPGPTRACAQASTQGLKCLFQRGSWNHLVTLNIPAILSLTDRAGNNHRVLLTGILDEDRVMLRIGGSSYPVSTSQLNDMWFGDSLLLWRPHAGADRLLGPGARGAGVRWLRDGLGKLAANPPPTVTDPALYDESLSEQVRNFQRNYGLRVDGIAGERTLVKLQALLRETGVPLLTKDS